MKIAGLGLLLVILALGVNAQLYGDLLFEIKDNGDVEISGETNYDEIIGITNKLTSKEGELWFLNITTPVFEEYIYKVKLPKYAIINYIKANNRVRIEETSGMIRITGTGSDKPIEAAIQYTISTQKKTLWILRIVGIIAVIIAALLIDNFILRRAKKFEGKPINRILFTDRQLKIIDYLQKHGTATQAKLEKDLELPKSSLSRNIKILVQKEVIFSETKGMSKVVGLK